MEYLWPKVQACIDEIKTSQSVEVIDRGSQFASFFEAFWYEAPEAVYAPSGK